ncbi:MAG: hypothetical protein OHK0045_20510 [Raineya sp.]
MRHFLLIGIFYICTRYLSFAQCVPTAPATFSLPAIFCPDEPVNFTNPYTGSGVSYEWDFCSEDMLASPNLSVTLSSVLGANTSVHSKIIEDNGSYYLFVLSRNNSRLYRLDLGDSPKNSPTAITDLGTIVGGNFTEPITIVKDDSFWYGFTCNVVSNNNFIKINFGTSITNQPSYTFWGNISSSTGNIRAFDIFREGSQYYMATVGVSNNKVTIWDLGTNLSGDLSTAILTREDTFSNISTPLCLRTRKDCNGWNVVVGSSNSRNFVFTFNSGLSNAPISNEHFLPIGFTSTFALDVLEENGKFYVVNVDISGKTQLFSFGNSFLNSPTSTNFGTITSNPSFANLYGISGVKHQSGASFFLVDIVFNRIFRIDFERDCGVNTNTSTLANPTNISYRNVGSHPVVLNVKNLSGEVIQRYEGNANVNPTTTVGNFSAQNACLGNAIAFNNTSIGADSQVASWLWDFGDGNTSALKNPTHTYSAAGTYNVSLTVNNLNGCNNTISKQIVVSAGVHADFQEVSTACVGQNVNFQNLSTFTNLPFDEAEGFYWDFGDGTFSPFQHPNKTYTTAGNYTITLTVKDQAGCTDVVSKNITILDNPAVSFNVPANICAGVPVQFTSISNNATEFLWFFEGHGTSPQINPIITFTEGGFYDVTLQVRNNNNCIATFTVENIQVLPAPKIIFNAQKIAGAPLSIRFENFSTGAIQYTWFFGDGNTSTLTHPTHTYSQAGEYLVRLQATNESGCQSVFEQIVSVGTLQTDIAVSGATWQNERITLTLENKGNTILNDIQIQVSIADTTLKEIYSPILLPNEQKEITLSLVIPEDKLKQASFFCAKALPKPSVKDINLSNNEACLNIKQNFLVFEPYPNPAQKEIYISFTAPNQGILQLYIQDVLGRTISQSFIVSKGFNKQVLNIESLSKGVYILTFDFEGKIFNKKIIVY